MKVGASRYRPGLTVRWNDIGDDWASLYAPRLGSVLLIERRGDYEWAVHSFIRGEAHRDTITVPRRCDAKRAAEVLVGQWWREKCEREAMRRRYARAMLAQRVPCFERLAMAARMAAASMNLLAAKGGDLDRLAEVYGVKARIGG